ncbi:MAG: tRNA lysidine(34) synthetase TilS, partial [Bacteroidota bacterium]
MHFLAERLRSQLHAMGEWPLRRSVLLSISGGRDSVTLLHAMLEAGIRPVLFHCNYLLREEDSNQDALLVAELAAQHGLMLESLKVPEDWKKEIQQQGRNLQDAARRFRYHALRDLSAPGGKYASAIVATAHHAMDQAETFLLALLKGRNMQRLSGLQSNRELWRPWLEIMPSKLEAYARDNAIQFRHDASNDSTAYDRNYLRNLVAPLL